MRADADAVQNAIVLGDHIVLTLADGTLNTRVLTCFHDKIFLSMNPAGKSGAELV